MLTWFYLALANLKSRGPWRWHELHGRSVCLLWGFFLHVCYFHTESEVCESWYRQQPYPVFWACPVHSLLSRHTLCFHSPPSLSCFTIQLSCPIWVNVFLILTSLPALPRREMLSPHLTPSYPEATQTLTICVHASFGAETRVSYLFLCYIAEDLLTNIQ